MTNGWITFNHAQRSNQSGAREDTRPFPELGRLVPANERVLQPSADVEPEFALRSKHVVRPDKGGGFCDAL